MREKDFAVVPHIDFAWVKPQHAELPPIQPKERGVQELESPVFSFQALPQEEIFEAPNFAVVDDFPNRTEPVDGILPIWIDSQEYEHLRNANVYNERIPLSLQRRLPPLRLDTEITAGEKIEGVQALEDFRSQREVITFISIVQSTKLNSRRVKQLFQIINSFKNLEILILRGLGIQSLKGLMLPRLRYLDVCDNRISTCKRTLAMTKHSPHLEIVDFSRNPVVLKDTFLPKMLAANPYIEIWAGASLSVDQRISAIAEFGFKTMRQDIDMVRWDMTLDTVPAVRSMRPHGWQPENITTLSVSNCKLATFTVSHLPNLQSLDISRNVISNLRGTGVERPPLLRRLDLSFNDFKKASSLKSLALLPSLRYLFLEGNPLLALKETKTKIVYITRSLRGTNRILGLQELDGVPISIEDHVRAVTAHGNSKLDVHDDPDETRWHRHLIGLYGHDLVRRHEFFSGIRSLTFKGMSFVRVSVGSFANLEVLDLSDNALVQLTGLESLRNLRMLDLSNNEGLSTTFLLQQLSQTSTLESLSLFVTNPATHKRALQNKTYRGMMTKTFLFTNRNLRIIDNAPINLSERVEAYRSICENSTAVEIYKFQLVLMLNCVAPELRRYHYDEVAIGRQYDPLAVTGLRKCSGWALVAGALDFSAFANIQELDLSNNQIEDIRSIGLQGLVHLRALSLANNQISLPHAAIGALIDTLPSLQIFVIHTNPVTRTSEDRLKILASIRALWQENCNLQVLDYQISIGDKVNALKLCAKNSDEILAAEMMRFQHALQTTVSSEVHPSSLQFLNLSSFSLEAVDVTSFVTIKVLVLTNNNIEKIEFISSISTLVSLEVLDLRNNNLSRLDLVAGLIEPLTSLTTLGLFGNKFAKDDSYRTRFLSMLPAFSVGAVSPLVVLDSQAISIKEIADSISMRPPTPRSAERHSVSARMLDGAVGLLNAAKNATIKTNQNERKVARWQVSLQNRLLPNTPLDLITEANFSCCKLSFIDLSVLPRVTKLSLAYNSITEQTLERSNIGSLPQLQYLDLTRNKLKNLDQVCILVDLMESIEHIWLEENPCCPADNAQLRVRFFRKINKPQGAASPRLLRLNGLPPTPADLSQWGLSRLHKQG